MSNSSIQRGQSKSSSSETIIFNVTVACEHFEQGESKSTGLAELGCKSVVSGGPLSNFACLSAILPPLLLCKLVCSYSKRLQIRLFSFKDEILHDDYKNNAGVDIRFRKTIYWSQFWIWLNHARRYCNKQAIVIIGRQSEWLFLYIFYCLLFKSRCGSQALEQLLHLR